MPSRSCLSYLSYSATNQDRCHCRSLGSLNHSLSNTAKPGSLWGTSYLPTATWRSSHSSHLLSLALLSTSAKKFKSTSLPSGKRRVGPGSLGLSDPAAPHNLQLTCPSCRWVICFVILQTFHIYTHFHQKDPRNSEQREYQRKSREGGGIKAWAGIPDCLGR